MTPEIRWRRRRDDDEFAGDGIAAPVAPSLDGFEVFVSGTLASGFVETRPDQCGRATQKHGGASLIGVGVLEQRCDAPLRDDSKTGLGTQCLESAAFAELEKHWTNIASDFDLDDRKNRRPPTVRSTPPDRDADAAARTKQPPHDLQCLARIGHVHQAKSAEHGIEAAAGQHDVFKFIADETDMARLVLPSALPRNLDHARRGIDTDHAAAGRHLLRGAQGQRAGVTRGIETAPPLDNAVPASTASCAGASCDSQSDW